MIVPVLYYKVHPCPGIVSNPSDLFSYQVSAKQCGRQTPLDQPQWFVNLTSFQLVPDRWLGTEWYLLGTRMEILLWSLWCTAACRAARKEASGFWISLVRDPLARRVFRRLLGCLWWWSVAQSAQLAARVSAHSKPHWPSCHKVCCLFPTRVGEEIDRLHASYA